MAAISLPLALLAALLLAAIALLPGATAFSIPNIAASVGQQQAAEKNSSNNKSKKRVSILLCPAQFCVPDDYDVLFDSIR